MIVLISGSNRPDNNSRRVARVLEVLLKKAEREVFFIDLEELPAALFLPTSYASKPAEFAPIQEAILEADGILTVVPEYNGSFPGALKYFIDMLLFPESLVDKPAAFVGLAAGPWGGLRAIEQLETVFLYRKAHLFNQRVCLPYIEDLLTDDGSLADAESRRRLEALISGFVAFCRRISR